MTRTPWLAAIAVAGCGHDFVVVERHEVATRARDLDLLFVIDDSPAMAELSAFRAGIPALLSRLAELDGELPDLHVGTTVTDLGTKGSADPAPGPPIGTSGMGGCAQLGRDGQLFTFAANVQGTFLIHARDGTRNYSGTLAEQLEPMTTPGDGGCDFEQPLEAARRALDPAKNPGFVRPDALLAIVVVSNEDDCSIARSAMLDPDMPALGPLESFRCTEHGVTCDPDEPRAPGVRSGCAPRDDSPFMTSIAELRTFLDTFKPEPRDVVFAAVAGPPEPFEVALVPPSGGGPMIPTLRPSCRSPTGPPGFSADPAVRLAALAGLLGNRGDFTSICDQAGALERVATLVRNVQTTCFDRLTLADGERCNVIGVEGELPSCDAGPAPCWRIEPDPAACPVGDHLAMRIEVGTTRPATDARIVATCQVGD